MKQINLNIRVKKPFGNLFREKAVLVVVEDVRGNFLVGAKPYQYPPTITRLLGGGVDKGESESAAVVREMKEELGVTLNVSQFTPLLLFAVTAEDAGGKKYMHQTRVYYTNIGNTKFKPGDDVKVIEKLTIDELYKLGELYEALPDALWYNGPEGEYSWKDYAKLYGPIHKQSAKAVVELQKQSKDY